ncbi:OmpA family protein [Agarivorans sp. DSG3-1]|uniref:OmpA family protein n=1 Tax=Agarivorans sp. DSG3-1 TaxID=3342249 RepID=UPI00398F00E6
MNIKNTILMTLCLLVIACAKQPDTQVTRHQIDDLRDHDNDGVINQRDKCRATPSGTLIDNNGCAIWLSEQSFAIHNVLFDLDKFEIRNDQHEQIQHLALTLQQNPQLQVTLIGDTSSEGNENYNHRLAQQRTDAITLALTKQGIDKQRIQIQEYYQDTDYTHQLKQRKRRVIAVLKEQQLQAQTQWTIYSSEEATLRGVEQ